MLDYHLSVQTILNWDMLKGHLVVHWSNGIDFCRLWTSVDLEGVIVYVTLYHGGS